jgi:hypothetical protein
MSASMWTFVIPDSSLLVVDCSKFHLVSGRTAKDGSRLRGAELPTALPPEADMMIH